MRLSKGFVETVHDALNTPNVHDALNTDSYMEPGESTEETARREILEETGLEIGRLTLFKVYAGTEFFYKCPNGDQVFAVCVVYATNDIRGDLQPDGDEGSEVKYFPIYDLPRDMLPQVRMMIESFLQANGM